MTSFAFITDDAAQGMQTDLGKNISFININHNYPIEYSSVGGQSNLLISLTKKGTIESIPEEELTNYIKNTNATFDEVFCLLSAAGISSLYLSVEELSKKYKGKANFHLIDTETLSIGQGYLVNFAVQQIINGIPPQIVDEKIRNIIPNIYTLLCTPDLSYLYANGFLDSGQLVAGEQHSIHPVFSLENGFFNHLEKFKNLHGIEEYFIEFLEEYENLQALAIILPLGKSNSFFHEIKHFSMENLKINSYSEVNSNQYLRNLIGPNGFGMILIE